jgi:hypothetical protein
MPGISGPTSPPPFAFYDPGMRSLRTSQGTFDSDSIPSSPTLPRSGSMRSGALSARRRSALPTSASACSSSPGLPTPAARDWRGGGQKGQLPTAVLLLKTPTAQLAINGGSQHPDKRKAGGHGPTLADEVEWLLPTPLVGDSKGARQATAKNPRSPQPTLTDLAFSGALTDPPSRSGRRSPAAPPPGQLTIWGD